jgi:hypothetical protein
MHTVHKSKFKHFQREDRLDLFYADLVVSSDTMKDLWKVVKLVLMLSHGNAAVEGGFSVNKELLIDNMTEETVVAQRVVFDAIRIVGMDVKKVEIAKQMLTSVRHARATNMRAWKRKKCCTTKNKRKKVKNGRESL